jgi:hypothetical protein
MLQINTGKLFTRKVIRTNQLAGVLYSNARLPYQHDIRTDAGSLRSTGSGDEDLAIIYELEERIEDGPSGPGVLISHTVGPYLDDFAVVASFGLGAVFSREPAVVRGLTDGRPSLSTRVAPQAFISKFFDRTIHLTDRDVQNFQVLVSDLLALERKSFLGVMQAMRTFVAGLHRIPENLGQAYTMIVSAVESLAQGFDGFVPVWADLNERKRKAIDQAIAELDPTVADNVRKAALSHEHVALARRYRAFTLSHIDAAFFRQENTGGRPIARYELEPAVKMAYELRSGFIHQLRPLPSNISHPHAHWETVEVERRPALTFEGLYRVTGHVVRAFIAAQPKIEQQEYDYTPERAGVIRAELAPEYWIWQPLTEPKHGRRRLEGLLEMILPVLAGNPEARLVDIRPMLSDVEKLLPQAPREHRPALVCLHVLFNLVVHPDQRTPGFDSFIGRYAKELEELTIETIVIGTLLGAVDDEPAEAYARILEAYFDQRVQARGLHAPRLAEAAMCLTLAEKYRKRGVLEQARAQLDRAFEVHPEHRKLRDMLHQDIPNAIEWREILLTPHS